MAQSSPDAWFPSTWGSIRLWLSSIETDNSRSKVVHELSNGNTHPVQDRGLKPRRARCQVMFDNFPGEADTPSNAFRKLKAAVDSGASAIFSHPVEGSYLAEVGDFTYKVDEHSNVVDATIEFIAAEEIEPISPAGAGVLGAVGEVSVSQAADDLDAALEAVGLQETDEENPLTSAARAASSSWASGDLETGDPISTRQILADTADLSAQIADLIDTGGLSAIPFEDDLSLFDAYRAAVTMGDAIRTAALAATSDAPSTFVVRVTSPTALLSLAAKIYGGADADDYARQVADLNDVRTPGWLDLGDYIFPNKTAAQRAGF